MGSVFELGAYIAGFFVLGSVFSWFFRRVFHVIDLDPL